MLVKGPKLQHILYNKLLWMFGVFMTDVTIMKTHSLAYITLNVSYPAGSTSVVDSVVLLLVCSVVEVVLGLGSAGAARPKASWPGEGLPLLLLAAGDRFDGEDGGGVWRATPQRLFSSPLDVNSTLSERRHRDERAIYSVTIKAQMLQTQTRTLRRFYFGGDLGFSTFQNFLYV